MNPIIKEIEADVNSVLEKVVQAQTGLPPGITDPVLTKVEGGIESVLGHLGKHSGVPATAAAPAVVPPPAPPAETLAAKVAALCVFLTFGLVVFWTSGCSTAKTLLANPTTDSTVVQTIARTGANYAIAQDTNAVPYFKATVVVLDQVIASNTVSSDSLSAALANVSTKELRNAQVVGFIDDALGIYEATESSLVANKLDAVPYLEPILVGLRNGIAGAVGVAAVSLP